VEVSATLDFSACLSDKFSVVKLFNAIQQSQAALAEVQEDAKAQRGSGKPTLPAPNVVGKPKGKKEKQKDNLIGRGKQCLSSCHPVAGRVKANDDRSEH
jgi:hypothetical protein